jgi:osmoprotectant transport system ATP-binding protein
MIALEFEDVIKRFPGASYNVVDRVSLTIEEGELVTIVGSSGCGKTTLLKLVNRIYEPDSGIIRLFGENSVDKDPIRLRHGIGYVIQQIGLFPHMTIRQNIATVPSILKWDKKRIEERVRELLLLVNLDPDEFGRRYPSQLSGGQQQRVGLARALAADPAVMLMDEPFGAIDAINRINLQDELLRIHKTNRKTYLFVTHDINEAFKLGSRILIMDRGAVQQFGKQEDIIRAPANGFVRSLLNSAGKQLGYIQGEGI